MNKSIKSTCILSMSLLIALLPVFIPFSQRAQVQAQNRVETVDAAPKGIDLNNRLVSAIAEAHKNQVQFLMLNMAGQKPLLKINRKDLERIKNKKIDRRILKTLNYLVTPREFGGAGYNYLKIRRIMKGYDTPISNRKISREYPKDTDPNISVHSSGQAVDIEEIDYIYSTLKESSLIKTKKKPQAPMPIKVAWQSNEGFDQSGGMETYNQSMQGLFNEYGTDILNQSLTLELADLYGTELDLNNLSLTDFESLAKATALEWFLAMADMPGLDLSGLNLSSLSWGELVREVSRGYLGDVLGIDSEGLRGNGFSEIKQNVGRAETEDRLGVPSGSLETKNGKSDEMLRHMATRRLEDDLEFARDSLKNIASETAVQKKFKDAVTLYHASRVDSALGMPPSSTPNYYTNILQSGSKSQISDALFNIGAYYASQILVNNLSEQSLVYRWITSKGSVSSQIDFNLAGNKLEIDETRLAGNVSLKSGDIENLFIKDGANAVFNRLGESTLLDGLGSAALENFDSLANVYADFNFYSNTAKDIQDQLESLKSQSGFSDIANTLAGIVSGLTVISGSEDNYDTERDIRSMSEAARELSQFEIQEGGTPSESIQELENNINSFVEGINLPFLPGLSMDDLDIPDLNIYGTNISSLGLLDAIASENPETSLQNIGIEILENNWEFSWALPSGTMKKLFNGENVSGEVETTLGNIASDYVQDEFGIDFSGEDLVNIFHGDFDSLIDVGGAMIDGALNLPIGSTAKSIHDGGDPEQIFENTGSLLISQFLGLDFPVSLEGNISQNIGAGIIETRLGFELNSLENYSNINDMISELGVDRVATIFHLDLNGANTITDTVIESSSDGIQYIGSYLKINQDSVKHFLEGGTTQDLSNDVGESSALQITADKLINHLGLDPSIKDIIQEDVIDKLITKEGWNTKDVVGSALILLAGEKLEEVTGLRAEELKDIYESSENFNETITEAGMRIVVQMFSDYSGFPEEDFDNIVREFYETNTVTTESLRNLTSKVGFRLLKEACQAQGVDCATDANLFAQSVAINGITQGNVKEFLNGASVAAIETLYNTEFKDEVGIDFQYIHDAVTANPELVNSWMTNNNVNPESATEEQIRTAERESRNKAQRILQYNIMDAQLHRIDPGIPQGFAEVMLEGDEDSRRFVFGTYIFDKIEDEVGIPSELSRIYTTLRSDFIYGVDITKEKYWDDVEAAATDMLDSVLRDKTGINFSDGTIDTLFKGNVGDALELNMSVISDFVDGYIGLPRGTTQLIYKSYQVYAESLKTYQNVLAGGDAEAIAQAKTAYNAQVAAIVVTLVNFAFGKQFAKLDQQFGLPAGTTSSIIGLGITWLITGAIPIIGVIGLAYNVLFGVYKVKMFSTPCNYQPAVENPPAWMKMRNPDHPDELGILPSAFPYCPGEWSYKPKFSSETFKDTAIQSAQYKVAMLIGDLLYMNDNLEALNDKIAGENGNMQPIQILTLREEDRNRYLYKVITEYGKTAGARGRTGVIISEKVWDVVHIGY
ncbi:MAG: hypothetical protein ABH837_02640 [bacterium]